MSFEIKGIDHIHLNVKDRSVSEAWYKKVFGFERTESLAFWAKDGGPLTSQNKSGSVHLALFASAEIQKATIAFSVTAADLRSCMAHLSSIGISVKPVDHEVSWSIYFSDPDGNPFEVTTYEYREFVQNA